MEKVSRAGPLQRQRAGSRGAPEAAAGAIPGQQHVATKADIADLKADIARDFQMLYRHLWIMGVGIVAAIVTLTRMLA